MNLGHLHAFTAAMQRKDLEAMLTHMADDIVLKTPLAAEPFEGKTAIRPVVEALLRVVDRFDFREIMQGPTQVSAFFCITVGPHELDGVDYWRIDDAGLIREMTVLCARCRPSWRCRASWRTPAERKVRHRRACGG